VSNLFGVGGIGGVINFIDKTGTDTATGIAQLELSDTTAYAPTLRPVARHETASFTHCQVSIATIMVRWIPASRPRVYQIRGNLKKVFDTARSSLLPVNR